MGFVRVSQQQYREIIDHLDNQKKIAAIKALRIATKMGLKEAKEAIEKIQHESGQGDFPHAFENGLKLVAGPKIKKMILDYGKGEVEVDLETMELKALMELQTIGLDACADILDLVTALKSYSAGMKIGVLDEDR